jgi:hypothetical protein
LTAWNTATNSTQAKLQAYYKGQCFYRINVKDDTAVEDANKFLVRRNHIYNINVTKFNGPGIGNPGSIVTPNPALPPGELGEADTYVTATINVLPWHRVNQNATGEL